MKWVAALLIAVAGISAACSTTSDPPSFIDDLLGEPIVITEEARIAVDDWYNDIVPSMVLRAMTTSDDDPVGEWESLSIEERKRRFPLLWNDILPSEFTEEHEQLFAFISWGASQELVSCDPMRTTMLALQELHGLSLGDARFMAAAFLGVVRNDQPDWLLRWTTCDLAGEFEA